MRELVNSINELKNSSVANVVNSRSKEFTTIQKKGNDAIFSELCFCLLTANFSASGGIKIQNEVNDGFFTLPNDQLAKKLAELGHRFPNTRAKYIVESRLKMDELFKLLKEVDDELVLRNWLVKSIKGLGMKESSHFLRNIGFQNLAIIDFHIIDILVKYRLIEKPKNLSPKKYLEIENVLRKIANETGLKLGKLDLYLWYLETGKILK